MAPHRLRRRKPLQYRAEGLHGWRWWIIRHTPTILIDNLLEVLLAIFAFISGLSALLRPRGQVLTEIPWWALLIYGIAMILASLFMGFGLLFKRWGTAVAYGLRMLGLSLGAFVILAIIVLGEVTQGLALSGIVAVFALWRGFILYATYLLVQADVKAGEPQGPP